MSLSSAFQISRSGLNSVSKWSEVTSRNVSNANTEGYTRKTVQFSTYGTGAGQGVQVSEIRREVDTSLDRLYRTEVSKFQSSQTVYEGIDEYVKFIGQPSDERSLAYSLSRFETALVDVTNSPGNSGAQRAFLDEAMRLAGDINENASVLSELSSELDRSIQYEVADFNELLVRLQAVNDRIAEQGNQASAVAGELEDEQAVILNQMSESMDIIWRTDSTGQVDVYTSQGTPILTENDASLLSFNQLTGELYAGTLEITPFDPTVRSFSEGRLGGMFELRSDVIPRFQLQLDEAARTLIENFEAADGTLAPGAAGLFVDTMTYPGSFNVANLNGLSSRIAVNDLAIPENGGELYRVRDGMGAVAAGPASDTTLLQAYQGALDANNTYAAATNLPSNISLKTFMTDMVALQQTERSAKEIDSSNIAVAAESLQATRLAVQGVNIDDELQNLIRIEQAYAANSQVIRSVSEMVDTLLAAF